MIYRLSFIFFLNLYVHISFSQIFKPFTELNTTLNKELNLSIEINSNLKNDLGSFFCLAHRFHNYLGLNIYAGGTDKSLQCGISIISYLPFQNNKRKKDDFFLCAGLNKIIYKSQNFSDRHDRYRLTGNQIYFQSGYQGKRKDLSLLCHLKTTLLNLYKLELFETKVGEFSEEIKYSTHGLYLINQLGLKVGLKTSYFNCYMAYDILLNGNKNQIHNNAFSIGISGNVITLSRLLK